jgi:hypothetical protein
MPGYMAAISLKKLCGWLFLYFGKKILILLNEYDTPLQETYVNGYWEIMKKGGMSVTVPLDGNSPAFLLRISEKKDIIILSYEFGMTQASAYMRADTDTIQYGADYVILQENQFLRGGKPDEEKNWYRSAGF